MAGHANLNVQYGLRWEAQLEPDPITPRDEVFYRAFIGKPGIPVRRHDPVRHQHVAAAPWHLVGSQRRRQAGHPRQCRHVLPRIPGLTLASIAVDKRQPGQTLFRCSAFNGFGVTPPAWPNLIPQADGDPDHPDVFVFDKNFQNPRT